jgi:type I restriction enzyme S subunit
VPSGYKQTEVGVIPAGWAIKKFSEITNVITCGVAATPRYVNESVGKPFLSAQNVSNEKVVYSKYKFISNELFNQISKHNKPERGDVLYTRVGAGIGEAGVIEDDFAFGIYVSLTLIKVNPSWLDSYFILYVLNSPHYRFMAKNTQFAGGGVQNLNVQVVREFPIAVPSIREQRAIRCGCAA